MLILLRVHLRWSRLWLDAAFGTTPPLAYMLNMVLCIFMMAGNLNHAGIPFLGFNPMCSPNGCNLGIGYCLCSLLGVLFLCQLHGLQSVEVGLRISSAGKWQPGGSILACTCISSQILSCACNFAILSCCLLKFCFTA
jgi:hypothetical protein